MSGEAPKKITTLAQWTPKWLRDNDMRMRFVAELQRTDNISATARSLGLPVSVVRDSVQSVGGKKIFKRRLGIGATEADPQQMRDQAVYAIADALKTSSQAPVPGLFVSRGTALAKGVMVPLVQLIFRKPGSAHDPVAFDTKLIARVTKDLSDKKSSLHKAARAAGVGRVDVVSHPTAVRGISTPSTTSVII